MLLSNYIPSSAQLC